MDVEGAMESRAGVFVYKYLGEKAVYPAHMKSCNYSLQNRILLLSAFNLFCKNHAESKWIQADTELIKFKFTSFTQHGSLRWQTGHKSFPHKSISSVGPFGVALWIAAWGGWGGKGGRKGEKEAET